MLKKKGQKYFTQASKSGVELEKQKEIFVFLKLFVQKLKVQHFSVGLFPYCYLFLLILIFLIVLKIFNYPVEKFLVVFSLLL